MNGDSHAFMGHLTQNKNASWNLLRVLGQEQDHPWLVSGDFNEIMYSFEKKGGQPMEEKKMAEFREVLKDCQLIDVGYSGAWNTWREGINQKRILKKDWIGVLRMKNGWKFFQEVRYII